MQGALGFRPFFLLAALFAMLAVPLWLVAYRLGWTLPSAAAPVYWHGHEMVFGFGGAVIAGFLLTAARTWTKLPTATGGRLLGLVLLWSAGRAALLLGGLLPADLRWLASALDVLFFPAVAAVLAVPILRARSWRNLGFIAMLLALAGANLLFHLQHMASPRATRLALDVVVVMIVVMGGRVIPMFTQNGVPGLSIRPARWLDWLVLATTVLVAVAAFVGHGGAFPGPALTAAGANGLRLARWQPHRTLGHPLVWILHAAIAWIVLGLLLQALTPFASFARSAALHAVTVGGIGGIILGMMSRVSLGHTGRMLAVPRRMTVAFVLLNAAALVRVLGPLAAPRLYPIALDVAGTLWVLAFALFFVTYWPVLTRPRVDGKPG